MTRLEEIENRKAEIREEVEATEEIEKVEEVHDDSKKTKSTCKKSEK